MRRSPSSCAQMICALDFFQESPYEIAFIGSGGERKPFLEALHECFLPNKVLLAGGPVNYAVDLGDELPLLTGKLGDEADSLKVYVCRDSVCSQPVNQIADLIDLLKSS